MKLIYKLEVFVRTNTGINSNPFSNQEKCIFKLPKNAPEDEEFIKKAHQDPNWPEDLDKPCDWDKVSLWGKIWFRIKDTVVMVATVTFILVAVISCHEIFFDGESVLDETYCEKSSNGCNDY